MMYHGIKDLNFEFELPRKYIIKFINIYKKTLSYDAKRAENYLDFGWGISSGELSFINLFSRLLNAKNQIKVKSIDGEKDIQSYLILFDEIDLYLHPEWSRKNIYLLNEILPIIYDKPIQLVLTTHSPSVLSDLPKENITFLKKYKQDDREVEDKNQKEGNCKVIIDDELQELENTFAQNIHTLLSNSFFLNEGTIGEFAKHKINEILAYFNKKNNIYDDKKIELFRIIDIIGEEFIRNKLIDMYHRKFPKTNEDEIIELEKQREYIDKKIKSLKK